MQKDDLRDLLNQPYKQENWKKVIDFVFPNVSYLQVPKQIPFNSEKIETFGQIGTIRLNDGKNLALFEVHLFDNVNIARNRVELRNLVAPLIDQERNHGVLVIYEQGSEDYRFTFTAKETHFDEELNDFCFRETETKRFTYLLGSNEPCRTVSERLWELSQNKNNATIHDVEKAFSVERLSKEFFTKYKLHYQFFVDYLYKSNYKSSVFCGDEKAIRDFVKKMLGRVVFLHFVQKKAWLGASSKEFVDGDKNFMRSFWEKSEKGDDFYFRHLKRLFFEGLGEKDRYNLSFILPNGERTLIPYLGGGLFESETLDDKLITFPSILFNNLFEFFSEYNFTIDENDPFENEVGIDPEMLGRIFENLLEDNKDKGAFYTPKPIVKYMCQESLIQYILTYFKSHPMGRKGRSDGQLKFLIDRFVRKYEVKDIIEYDTILGEALYKVKICDPAIGSGAFPMGLLLEIMTLINVLHDASPDVVQGIWGLDKWKSSEIKKHIIQNSIYGVDIEKGAVDIARLRFWLSLVVDEEFPQPLPNLDYKIMQGNSLLEQFEGIDLSKSWLNNDQNILQANEPTLFEETHTKYYNFNEIKETISDLVNKYFTAENKLKKQFIHKEIDALVLNHLEASLTHYDNNIKKVINELERKLSEKLLQLSEEQKKLYADKSKESKEIRRNKELLQKKSYAHNRLIQLERQEERPYFLWHLFFKDVFEKGGFDIIIGNPPYIQLQKIPEDAYLYETSGYLTFTRTGDIYCLFYEKGFDILKDKGVLTYITSNKWMRGGYGKLLRSFFTKVNTIKILNLGPGIFQSATVDTNIYVGKKEDFENQLMGININNKYDISRINDKDLIPLKGVNEHSWIILDEDELTINQAFIKFGKPLKDWGLKINFGIKTGFNDAFIIDQSKRNELVAEDPSANEIIRPILKGREIQRYYAEWSNDYIINSHNGIKEIGLKPIDINNFPSIKKFLDSDALWEKVRKRQDQGDTPYNLRNCAYLNEFKKEKVIWKRIGSIMRFAYSDEEIYSLDSTCIATGEKIKYLTAVLNSKVGLYQLLKTSPQTGTGDQIISVQALEPLLVHYPTEEVENKFNKIVDLILFIRKSSEPIITFQTNETLSELFEELVDLMVYELYFEEHMKEKNIDVLQFVQFPDITVLESFDDIIRTIQKLYSWLKEKDNPIRNRILVSESRSWIVKKINESTH